MKEIRRQIAADNDIDLVIEECTYKGDCLGTCPRCEAEVRYLERELEKRQRMGKVAVIAGLSLGTMLTASSCNQVIPPATGIVPNPNVPDSTECLAPDTTDPDYLYPLAGDVLAPEPDTTDTVENTVKEEEIFGIVEDLPDFRGGTAKMMEFIAKNIKYPQAAIENGVEGKVYVRFWINEDGSLSDFEVLRGIGYGCDEEAVRVLKMMPRWKPGKQNGVARKMSFQIPIVFKLEDKKEQVGDVVSLAPIKGEVDNLENEVYEIVEQMPEFPGGQEAMEKYIKDNIRIGEAVSKWQADAWGRIYVNFIIEPDGSITNVKVLRGVFLHYDEEAVRVVKSMPNWKPGMQRGKPVRVSYTIPIVWHWG